METDLSGFSQGPGSGPELPPTNTACLLSSPSVIWMVYLRTFKPCHNRQSRRAARGG
jgi:hypothetical protein